MSELAINEALRDYSIEEDWDYRDPVRFLHAWVGRFNQALDLRLKTPVLHLEGLRIEAAGRYRPGRNGSGLAQQISWNKHRLDDPQAVQLAPCC
jgi:hypothetical protein